MARTYWIDLFTLETWKEFQDHGSDVSGFSEKRRTTVQKIKPGDYLLCYLTRVSRWVGLLEVLGEPYFDEQPIWSSQTYPSRVSVRVLLALPPEQGVPVLDMRDELTVFRDLGNPNKWQGPFRGSPTKWKTIDGEAVARALEDAKAHPVERPLGRSFAGFGADSACDLGRQPGWSRNCRQDNLQFLRYLPGLGGIMALWDGSRRAGCM